MNKQYQYILVGNMTYTLYYVSANYADCAKYLQKTFSGLLPELMWLVKCPKSWSQTMIQSHLEQSKRNKETFTVQLSRYFLEKEMKSRN